MPVKERAVLSIQSASKIIGWDLTWVKDLEWTWVS